MDDDTQATGTDAPAQADTADPQASEADVQANNVAPEATQGEAEAKEAEATEVKAEDTADEKLYAGKYKSPEEMEKAYKELESKFGATTSEKAELTRILNEAFATPEPAPAATETDAYAETNPQDERIDRIERQGAVQNFIFAHPDADATAMQKVLAEDPMLKQIPGHDAKLEYAYLKSQNMTTSKVIAEAKKDAASQAQSKIVEKQAAQVETAKKAEQTDEKSELMNKMSSGSIEQREQARRQYIRKYLV